MPRISDSAKKWIRGSLRTNPTLTNREMHEQALEQGVTAAGLDVFEFFVVQAREELGVPEPEVVVPEDEPEDPEPETFNPGVPSNPVLPGNYLELSGPWGAFTLAEDGEE